MINNTSEYVKCISVSSDNTPGFYSGNTLNKIYKVENWNFSNTDFKLVNENWSCNRKRFEPSTEEAYNLQEGIVKELIYEYIQEGGIYIFKYSHNDYIYINKITNIINQKCTYININNIEYVDSGYYGKPLTIRHATNEEKQWLEKCIELNKYVTKEEALTPVKMTKEQLLAKAILDYPIGTVFNASNFGRLYGTVNLTVNSIPKWYSEGFIKVNTIGNAERTIFINGNNTWANIISKPKVKDDFILPKNWYVKVTPENKRILVIWIGNYNDLPLNAILGKPYINDDKGWTHGDKLKGKSYDFGQEITFEQFNEYVLKTNNKIEEPKITNNKSYTIEQIEKALKGYDKDDIKDILECINEIK